MLKKGKKSCFVFAVRPRVNGLMTAVFTRNGEGVCCLRVERKPKTHHPRRHKTGKKNAKKENDEEKK